MILLQNLFTFIMIINFPLAVTVIFLERRNVSATWAWLMVLLFLPVIGFGVYLILGQNLSHQKLYKINKRNRQVILDLIESQREHFRNNDIVFNDPAVAEYRDMIYMNLSSGFALYTQNNEIGIFTEGTAKFEALFRDIEQASDHIHLMYYIVENDGLGSRLVEALTRKAQQGVKVRFLYDDIGSHKLPRNFFDGLRRAGGEAAAFFPSRIPYLNIRVNYRNHRKLVIIDGKIGYIGGLNVGDEYLGLNERLGYWRDTHLRLQGGAVFHMQALFALDWNLASPRKLPDRFDAALFPIQVEGGTVGVQIVSSGPNQTMEQIKNVYLKMILSAKESIYIQTPYFIPDESLLTALKMAVLSGVDVRLMLPSRPDHHMVFWASRSYLGELLEIGMKCYLYEKGFLHAKMILADGKVASVGTANLDIRSFRLNFEVTAVIYDTMTAGSLKAAFEEDMRASSELTAEAHRRRPRLHRFKESCTRLLSPIL